MFSMQKTRHDPIFQGLNNIKLSSPYEGKEINLSDKSEQSNFKEECFFRLFQRKHVKEYEQYLAVKRTGVPRLLIPLEDGNANTIHFNLLTLLI